MALCTAVKVIDAVALIVPFKEAGFDKLGNGTTEIVWIGVQKGPRYGGDRRLKGTPISMV